MKHDFCLLIFKILYLRKVVKNSKWMKSRNMGVHSLPKPGREARDGLWELLV